MACGFKADALRDGARRRGTRRSLDRLHRGARAARHRGPAPPRRRPGPARRALRRRQRRPAHRPRPERARAPARGDRRRGDDRPAPGRRPELLRARPPPRGRRGARLPREARPGRDRHRRGQRRRLRDRALGDRADPAPAGAVSIEREIFPQLVGNGLYGLRLEGYWMDIGTPERYLQASWDILEGRVRDRARRQRRAVRRRRSRGLAGGQRRRAGRWCAPARGSATARSSPRACCCDGCQVGAAGRGPGLDPRPPGRGRRRRDRRRGERDRRAGAGRGRGGGGRGGHGSRRVK